MRRMKLDQTDWRILTYLQENGRMSNVDLAKKLDLSAPPCLRRVRALEEAGFIEGYEAKLDAAALGFGITVFAMVRLHNQSEADLDAFEEYIKTLPAVREAHMLNGEIDYILKCVARDLASFQRFLISDLTSAPNVASVKTSLTIRSAKREADVPIDIETIAEEIA